MSNYKVPTYTRADLIRLGKGRKDATIHQIWPAHGKPHTKAFYFDPGNGDLRPSLLVDLDPRERAELARVMGA